MTIQAQRIATERDRAERERQGAQKVSNVMINVFAIADPFQSFANHISGSAVLDQAAESIERELQDQPVPRAQLLQALGRAYVRRGEFKPAVNYLNQAVEVLGHTSGAQMEALTAMLDLSKALCNSGDLHRAENTLVDAESLLNKYGLLRSAEYGRLLQRRGCVQLHGGRIPAARANFEASLRIYQTETGAQPIEIAGVLADLSLTHMWSDDPAEAERLARNAIEIYEIAAPPMHPERIMAEVALADVLFLQGRAEESASILEDALRKSAEVFGRNSTAVAEVLDRLAMVKYSQHHVDEAERYSRDALAICRRAYGEKHAGTANVATTLARTLLVRRKYPEAEAILRYALDIFAETLPPDHQYVASAEYFLGEVLLATNRPAEAESVLTASMNRWKRGDAPPWRAMRSANALGEALYRQGRTAEGGKYLSESLRELSSDPKADREAKDKARARAKRYLRTTLASR
jgi:tetratricopeptide (TPR) repeat protein